MWRVCGCRCCACQRPLCCIGAASSACADPSAHPVLCRTRAHIIAQYGDDTLRAVRAQKEFRHSDVYSALYRQVRALYSALAVSAPVWVHVCLAAAHRVQRFRVYCEGVGTMGASACAWVRVRCAVCGVRCAVCGVRGCGVHGCACGVRCAVCGVRCAVCGVRCAVCGVRCAVCGVRLLASAFV